MKALREREGDLGTFSFVGTPSYLREVAFAFVVVVVNVIIAIIIVSTI